MEERVTCYESRIQLVVTPVHVVVRLLVSLDTESCGPFLENLLNAQPGH